ncbi:MAG: DUF6088 family protein [Burkholderiales bacterium]
MRYKVSARLARKNSKVFVREDFKDLGGYDQVGRVLRGLENDGKLVRLGYGLYAKARKSALTGETIPVAPLPTLAKEALVRLGLEISASRLEKDYNAGRTTQVPTGRQIAVKGRISRKIGFGGAVISYEPAS